MRCGNDANIDRVLTSAADPAERPALDRAQEQRLIARRRDPLPAPIVLAERGYPAFRES